MVVNLIERRIFEMVEAYNGYEVFRRKKRTLTKETSLNYDLKLDEEEAYELLDDVCTEFKINHQDLNLDLYFPLYARIIPDFLLSKKQKRERYKKKITINMLIKSAEVGKWLYH